MYEHSCHVYMLVCEWRHFTIISQHTGARDGHAMSRTHETDDVSYSDVSDTEEGQCSQQWAMSDGESDIDVTGYDSDSRRTRNASPPPINYRSMRAPVHVSSVLADANGSIVRVGSDGAATTESVQRNVSVGNTRSMPVVDVTAERRRTPRQPYGKRVQRNGHPHHEKRFGQQKRVVNAAYTGARAYEKRGRFERREKHERHERMDGRGNAHALRPRYQSTRKATGRGQSMRGPRMNGSRPLLPMVSHQRMPHPMQQSMQIPQHVQPPQHMQAHQHMQPHVVWMPVVHHPQNGYQYPSPAAYPPAPNGQMSWY